MDHWLVPLLVVFTSATTCWTGWRRLGLVPGRLPAALGRAFESVGATLIFFTANAGLSVLLVLGIRSFSDAFLSLHELSDRVLLMLSLLQALVFQAWRESSDAERSSA